MVEKVKVSREVANAIEEFLDECTRVMKRTLETSKGILVAEHCGRDWAKYEVGQYVALNDIDTFTLMQAMVNGYETEKSPEEKILATYQRQFTQCDANDICDKRVRTAYANAILYTLDTLGIKIKGINK